MFVAKANIFWNDFGNSWSLSHLTQETLGNTSIKTEKFEKEKEFTFKFYEKYFTISDSNNFEKIKYWKLYKIYETNDFFYLYINKDHAFLLEKNTFTKGDISTFYIFVKRKIWFKMI